MVTADGARHPADVLVLATGFDTTRFLAHIPVRGQGGRLLADEWRGGAHAYLGTMVAGFPNCYLLYGPNTNLGHNSILFMVERQVNLVLQALALQIGATGRRHATGSWASPRPLTARTTPAPSAGWPAPPGWPAAAAGTRTPPAGSSTTGRPGRCATGTKRSGSAAPRSG